MDKELSVYIVFSFIFCFEQEVVLVWTAQLQIIRAAIFTVQDCSDEGKERQ